MTSYVRTRKCGNLEHTCLDHIKIILSSKQRNLGNEKLADTIDNNTATQDNSFVEIAFDNTNQTSTSTSVARSCQRTNAENAASASSSKQPLTTETATTN